MMAGPVTVRDDYARAPSILVGVMLTRSPSCNTWSEATGFPTVGGTHVGPSAVVAVLGRVAAEWDGLTVTPDEYFSAGDRVVVLGETQGRHRATGKPFRSPFAHEWRLRGGRIISWRAHIDTALAQVAARADG